MSNEFALVLTNALRSLMKPQRSAAELAQLSSDERVFETRLVPKMKIDHFLTRIVEYMRADNETLLCGMYYVLLLCGETEALNLERDGAHVADAPSKSNKQHRYVLTVHNVHRFVFAAFFIAAKWRSEFTLSMEYYALVCGIGKRELHDLEWSMLRMLDFNAHVSEAAFHYTVSHVVSCTIRPSDVIPNYFGDSDRPGSEEARSVDDACAAVKYCNAHKGWSPYSALVFVRGLVHAFEDADSHSGPEQLMSIADESCASAYSSRGSSVFPSSSFSSSQSQLEKQVRSQSPPLLSVINVLKQLAMV